MQNVFYKVIFYIQNTNIQYNLYEFNMAEFGSEFKKETLNTE